MALITAGWGQTGGVGEAGDLGEKTTPQSNLGGILVTLSDLYLLREYCYLSFFWLSKHPQRYIELVFLSLKII